MKLLSNMFAYAREKILFFHESCLSPCCFTNQLYNKFLVSCIKQEVILRILV